MAAKMAVTMVELMVGKMADMMGLMSAALMVELLLVQTAD